MTMLDIRNLRVEFPSRRGHVVAISDLSLTVEPGEILGVVGESGAGKSTIGNAIIGLLEPPGEMTAGEIYLKGERIDTLPDADKQKLRGRHIGMIFQDPLTSLDPLQTIETQLITTIDHHLNVGEAEARQRAVKLLDDVGIPDPEVRITQYPHQFSGGMRQRVVIALALCAEPELIIADEPTTALDVSVQAQILDLMKGLCRDRNVGMILITHDMGVIAENCRPGDSNVPQQRHGNRHHGPNHRRANARLQSQPDLRRAASRQAREALPAGDLYRGRR